MAELLQFPDRRAANAARRRADARTAIDTAATELAAVQDVVRDVAGYVLFCTAETRAVVKSIELQVTAALQLLSQERKEVDAP